MLHDSVVVVVRTRPRAMSLAMTIMRKSTDGFPFLSYMGMGLSLAALRAAGAPLWIILCFQAFNLAPWVALVAAPYERPISTSGMSQYPQKMLIRSVMQLCRNDFTNKNRERSKETMSKKNIRDNGRQRGWSSSSVKRQAGTKLEHVLDFSLFFDSH